jgi:hypothetical protein
MKLKIKKSTIKQIIVDLIVGIALLLIDKYILK